MKAILQSQDEDSTRAIGMLVAEFLMPDGVLLLSGDLGSGKTVLTQGLAAGLGIDSREVQSPTFTLIREHEGGKGRLIHIDLYRLERGDVESLGVWEILAGPGVKAVEWAERLPFQLPGVMWVSLRVSGGDDCREIKVEFDDGNSGFEVALRSLELPPV